MKAYMDNFEINNIVKDFDFEYQKNYYVIYPWINEDGKLVRTLLNEKNGKGFVVKIRYMQQNNVLLVDTFSNEMILQEDIVWIKEKLIFSLGCKEDISSFVEMASNDEVLKVAMVDWKYQRNKSALTIFEALLNVICAQNIQFSRLYTMSYNLSRTFGKKIIIGNDIYYCFPTPEVVNQYTIEDIKTCKVGYRAKTIKEVAAFISTRKKQFDDIDKLSEEDMYNLLIMIKGIGPYTANLTMSIFLRLPNRPHIDSYVKSVLSTFYMIDPNKTDEEYINFCYRKWGRYAGWAISALTTDTEKWSARLQKNVNVTSGAHISNSPQF